MARVDARRRGARAPAWFAEAAVQQSLAGTAVLTADERFGFVLANPAYLSFLDPSMRNGVEGHGFGEVFPTFREGGADEPTYRLFRRVRDTGEAASRDEWAFHGLPGGTTYWRWSLAPLYQPDDEGASRHLLLTCVDITAQVVARREAEAERRRLRALQTIAEALGSTHEPREVAHAAMRALEEVLSASLVGVYVLDAERQALVTLAHPEGLPRDVEAGSTAIPLDDASSPALQTYLDGQVRTIYLEDPERLPHPRHQFSWRMGVRSLVYAPLQAVGERLGVVVANRVGPTPFGREDVELLVAACHQIGAALSRAIARESRREAHARLRVEAERLRVIMENTRAHLAYLDRDFRFVLVNSTYVEGCGHFEAELLGRNHFDLFPNTDNQAIFERVRDTGEPYQVLARPFEFADQPWRGTTYWDWTLTPVKDLAGQVEGMVISLVDVTESIRLRREAQRRATELEAILDSIADGVMLYGPSGDLRGMNHAAERLLGYTRSELQKTRELERRVALYEALGPQGQPFPPEDTPVRRALGGETVTGAAMRLRRPDGSLVDLLCSAAPIRHQDGELAGVVSTYQDVTPLLELDRLKDEFVSVASHELKSPLTSAKGFCQVLMRRAEKHPGCEPCVGNFRSIDTQVNRVVRLVDQLLDLSRLQVGRVELNREPTDLIEVAAQSAANAQVTTSRHEIRVRAEADDVVGDWDRLRLEQVLANLLSNAVKYSPQGGPIEVAVSLDAGWAMVGVTDHGVGIAPDDQERLFTRYYRTGESRTAAVEGLGLGLYISAGLIQAHGGRMFVQSEPGRGSTFGFRLPVS